MARVEWTTAALARLGAIRSYIAQFDADAAERLIGRLERAGSSLSSYPDRGRPSSSGIRELAVVPPYVIRYRVRGTSVDILDIMHGRQRR